MYLQGTCLPTKQSSWESCVFIGHHGKQKGEQTLGTPGLKLFSLIENDTPHEDRQFIMPTESPHSLMVLHSLSSASLVFNVLGHSQNSSTKAPWRGQDTIFRTWFWTCVPGIEFRFDQTSSKFLYPLSHHAGPYLCFQQFLFHCLISLYCATTYLLLTLEVPSYFTECWALLDMGPFLYRQVMEPLSSCPHEKLRHILESISSQWLLSFMYLFPSYMSDCFLSAIKILHRLCPRLESWFFPTAVLLVQYHII